MRNLDNYFAVVLRINRITNETAIWKVVATEDMAESYVKHSDDKVLYRYEMWSVYGKGNEGG